IIPLCRRRTAIRSLSNSGQPSKPTSARAGYRKASVNRVCSPSVIMPKPARSSARAVGDTDNDQDDADQCDVERGRPGCAPEPGRGGGERLSCCADVGGPVLRAPPRRPAPPPPPVPPPLHTPLPLHS